MNNLTLITQINNYLRDYQTNNLILRLWYKILGHGEAGIEDARHYKAVIEECSRYPEKNELIEYETTAFLMGWESILLSSHDEWNQKKSSNNELAYYYHSTSSKKNGSRFNYFKETVRALGIQEQSSIKCFNYRNLELQSRPSLKYYAHNWVGVVIRIAILLLLLIALLCLVSLITAVNPIAVGVVLILGITSFCLALILITFQIYSILQASVFNFSPMEKISFGKRSLDFSVDQLGKKRIRPLYHLSWVIERNRNNQQKSDARVTVLEQENKDLRKRSEVAEQELGATKQELVTTKQEFNQKLEKQQEEFNQKLETKFSQLLKQHGQFGGKQNVDLEIEENINTVDIPKCENK